MKRTLSVIASALLLAACAAPVPADYAAGRPALDLRAYFDGEVLAHGVFTDRAGKVVKRFTVRMLCQWNGDEGVLDEDFTYADGAKQRRIWRITRLADVDGQSRYRGRADDIVGVALGEGAGNALRWSYTLRLPVDGREVDVQLDDWMFLIDDRVLINKAVMSKFGFRLGDVTLSFARK